MIVLVYDYDEDLGLPEHTQAFLDCELGQGSSVVRRPRLCQTNGTWTNVEEACEGSND